MDSEGRWLLQRVQQAAERLNLAEINAAELRRGPCPRLARREAANSALASSSVSIKPLKRAEPFCTPLSPQNVAARRAVGLVDRAHRASPL
jgi:hypothetical protein